MRASVAAVAAVLVAAVACDSPMVDGAAAGYDPRLGGTDIYHWPLGFTLAVHVDPTAGGDALVEHVRAGFDAWRDSLYYAEASLRLVDDPADANVVVHHVNAPRLVDYGTCAPPGGGAAGVTFFCIAVSGDSLETLEFLDGSDGRVKMSLTIDPSRVGTIATLRGIVTHELGHVLGIGTHSPNSEDLMAGAPMTALPTQRDAAALRWLLHQPVTIRP